MAILGCGGVCLLLLLAVCGGGAYFIRSAYVEAKDFATSFEEQGYQRVSGQVIDERDQVTSPKVYFAQVARVYSDVNADLAFAVQVAEIHGTVDGDIDFYGQVLVIKPGAVVKGNVRVKWAQVVQIEGTVEGEVSGNYQHLQRQESPKPPDVPSVEVPSVDGETKENDTLYNFKDQRIPPRQFCLVPADFLESAIHFDSSIVTGRSLRVKESSHVTQGDFPAVGTADRGSSSQPAGEDQRT
jgi:hypothetical protein